MIVSIHQPNYLPYPGFFNKIYKSDVFIIYDTAQYVKNRWDNRNRIRSNEREIFLTIPIRKKDSSFRPFHEVLLPQDENWEKTHMKTIIMNYKKADCFEDYWPDIKKIYEQKWEYLVDLNICFIKYFIKNLGISVKVFRSSELSIDNKLDSTGKLISMVKAVNGSEYLSGPSGGNYFNQDMFSEYQIKLSIQKYTCPVYKQRQSDFIPNLSTMDMLLNVGNEAK